MAYLFPGALVPALDNNGNPLAGAKMHIYLAETVTPTSSWTSDEGSTPNSNPVLADAGGRWPPVYLDPDVPVRVLTTSASGDYTIYDVDHVAPGLPDTAALLSMLASTGGAALIGTSTGETVEDRLSRNSYGLGLFTDLAATPPVIDVAETMVYTTGHTAEGIGIARYIHDAAVDAAYVTAHPLSSFLADDGRGFMLDPKQELHIEMFGGMCDCPITETSPYSGTNYTASGAAPTGTDNLAAVNEAMLIGAGQISNTNVYVQPIHFYGGNGQNGYYFSDTIVPPRIIHFKGLASGQQNDNGTTFKFPADTGGMILHLGPTNPAGDYSTAGSIIEGIQFYGNGGTDRTAHGLWMRARANVRNCAFSSFAGNNIHNVAGVGWGSGDIRFGLTSGSYLEKISCKYAGNWNCYTADADSSASVFVSVQCRLSRLGGIYDNSGFGNTYIGCEIDDYGNARIGAVYHSGRLYVLINATAGIGASTTPGTNNAVWYDVGAGSVSATWPAWSGAATYELSLPLFFTGNSNQTAAIGTYIENFYPAHIFDQCPATLIGGFCIATRYSRRVFGQSASAGEAILSGTGFGGYKSYTPNHSTLGSYFTAGIGNGDGTIVNHRRGTDGDFDWYWAYDGADTTYRFSTNKVVWQITGASTARTYGRSAGVPYMFEAKGLALCDPNDSNNARIVWCGTGPPGSGNHARGEIVFNRDPSPSGTFAWVCTTTGTPGTWKAVSGIAA